MAKIIDVTKYGKNKKGHRRYMFTPSLKLGVTTTGFLTVFIICLLSLLYLVQANRTATYGFEIEKYEKMIGTLKEEKEKLELEAARLRSTNKIKEEVERMNMHPVDSTKISYYEIKKHLAMTRNNAE